MENSPESSFSDLDIKIGVARALGLSNEKTAEVADCSISTVKRRIVEPDIKRLEALARTILTLADANKASAVVATAQERVSALFDRAFLITERLIQKAEDLGDLITLEQAMDIHKNLTVWAGKHVVSEAPKRLEVDQKHEVTHRMVPSTIFAALENVMREQRALPEAIEAEIVEQTN